MLFDLSALDSVWAGPLLSSLRGRRFFLALFQEALQVTIERGDHGTRLTLQDQGGDRFELHTGDRVVSFERSPTDARVLIVREGFAHDLVPVGLDREIIEPPEAQDEAVELAQQQIRNAVKLLFRRRE